ncbi:heterokaryon incompatibility, partial [Schizothecium vesticola]
IRLIELLPGRSPDPIRCNLQATPLARSVKYECLSYCWGDTKNVVIILCNGVSLPVTANLMGALQALRQEDKPRRVWVDAICINQGSIPERNQQVAVMRDIYRNATRTVVWLGYEADDSNAALAIVPDLLTVRNTFGHRGDSSTPVEQARQAFLTLLQRPWFSRVWIVQEV